jgi:competence protein ComGC
LIVKTVTDTSGFSLVEVLLMIAVIGLLLGIALPNQLRAAKKANGFHCRANLEDIQSAIQKWSAEHDGQNPDAKVTLEDIKSYLARENLQCPSGGHYTLTTASEAPKCSVDGHALIGP